MRRYALNLPPSGSLPKPAPDDPLDYYYRWLTAGFYRARLRLVLRLLGDEYHDALLEVGYGSGVLLPELRRRTRRLVGLDVHNQSLAVDRALRALGVTAELREASLYEIPFEANTFSALVCVSVLEHLTSLDAAVSELARVVRPGGVIVIGFPARNILTDGLLKLLSYDPRQLHPSSHRDIMSALKRSHQLWIERCTTLPRWAPRAQPIYVACALRVR